LAKINRFRPTFIGATDRKKVGRNFGVAARKDQKKLTRRDEKKIDR
jgi:hypothetical protein